MKGAGEGRKEVEKGGGRVFRWYAARCQKVSSAASLVPLGYRWKSARCAASRCCCASVCRAPCALPT